MDHVSYGGPRPIRWSPYRSLYRSILDRCLDRVSIDTRSIHGRCLDRYLVNTRSTYNRYNAKLSSESRPLVSIAIMAVVYRSTIGRISVNCRPISDKLYSTSIDISADMSVTN